MAQHWKDVNWFRLFVVVGLSFLASMMFSLDDGAMTLIESMRTATQALIAGFAFLQCPETLTKSRAKK